MGQKIFLSTEAFISFPRKFLAILRILCIFFLLGYKIIPKHISCGIYPSQSQKHLEDGSFLLLKRDKPFISFFRKFSTNINVSMGFSIFRGENHSKHVLHGISAHPNNKAPERQPTSEHVMSLPGNLLAIVKVSLQLFIFPGKNILKKDIPRYLCFPMTRHLGD